MGVPFRQRPDEGAPMPFLGPAADIVDRAAEIPEQGLVHRLQNLGIADHRNQQAAARPVQSKQLTRRGVGQGDTAPGDVVRLAAADDQNRISQGLEHIAQEGAVRGQIDRIAAVQIADADQGLRPPIDQPGGRGHGDSAHRQPPRQLGLHHR
ncbi:hypothetical protein D3C80_1314100 [compost metagenome]